MNLIFSADRNWAVGYRNRLLFRTKGDMAFFRDKTMGKVVVMGRKTLESLPGAKPLPGRVNIVLSAQKDYRVEGAQVCATLADLFGKVGGYPTGDVYVIGGGEVYRQLMPYCDTAYVTKWEATAQEADCFLPNLDEDAAWKLLETSERQEENGLSYTFNRYQHLTQENI